MKYAIEGFEGRYEVTDDGRVFSLLRGIFLRLSPDSDGYPMVSLCHATGYRKSVTVHKLVARAFIGLRPTGLQINHIDGVKTNNTVGNLEYVTAQENEIHKARVLGKIGMNREQRSAVAKKNWERPEYRANKLATMIGRATNKGYKCTPKQIENRRRAARISNMKRAHGDGWREAYAIRYPQFSHEVQL